MIDTSNLNRTLACMQTYFLTQALGSNKRARTRGALLDSAISQIAEKGLDELRISEVAVSAGLSNGTFYNHFKDKDDLALAAAEAIALEIAKGLDLQMVSLERGASRIVVASTAFIEQALEQPEWGAVIVQLYSRSSKSDTPALSYLRADLRLAADQQKLPLVVDQFLLEQTGALMIAALRRQLADGRNPALTARTCDAILRLAGYTPTQARREVERAAAFVSGEDHGNSV